MVSQAASGRATFLHALSPEVIVAPFKRPSSAARV